MRKSTPWNVIEVWAYVKTNSLASHIHVVKLLWETHYSFNWPFYIKVPAKSLPHVLNDFVIVTWNDKEQMIRSKFCYVCHDSREWNGVMKWKSICTNLHLHNIVHPIPALCRRAHDRDQWKMAQIVHCPANAVIRAAECSSNARFQRNRVAFFVRVAQCTECRLRTPLHVAASANEARGNEEETKRAVLDAVEGKFCLMSLRGNVTPHVKNLSVELLVRLQSCQRTPLSYTTMRPPAIQMKPSIHKWSSFSHLTRQAVVVPCHVT